MTTSSTGSDLGSAREASYAELPNKLISAANGIDYAYRDAGDGGVPLVRLQHFRGNLDNWDPELIDALASGWRVPRLRQRRRRRLHRDDAGHRGTDGTRRHRLPRRHGPRPG